MNIKKILIASMAIMAVVGSIGMPAMAQTSGTLYVGTGSLENGAITYDSVDAAIENASDGDTIEIATGTYNTSAELTENNVSLIRYSGNTTGTVTLDATNETYGDAIYGSQAHNVTLGSNVSVSENTVTVDPDNSGSTGVYENISIGIDRVGSNGTVEVAPDTYKESVNVSNEYVGIVNNNPDNGNVTINATNTSSGVAFEGNYTDTLRVGQNIVVDEEVVSGFGGGIDTSGGILEMSIYGVPMWAIGLVAVVLGGGYYYENEGM